MISFHRRRECPPFLAPEPLRGLAGLRGFHASLRQGLYRFLTGPGRGRWRRALLPDFVAEGVYAPLRDAGLEIAFYPVALDLSVDAEALKAAREAHGADVLVYIHHFGLHREDNLRAVRGALAPGVLFIEDFAMTLPHAGLEVAGDLALFSFTKMLGVPEGGLIWFRDRGLLEPRDAEKPAEEGAAAGGPGELLRRRLRANLAFEDWIQSSRPRPAVQTLARRLLGARLDYYGQLTRHYREIGDPVSPEARELLERIDFEAVASRRREIARRYLAGLDRRLHLGAPEEAYLRHPLAAFPVRVDDQDRFHAFLVKGGVQGFRLTEAWWFREGPDRSELHRRHYLLPATHYLADGEVDAVIARANAYLRS